jgi:hypothetical protein
VDNYCLEIGLIISIQDDTGDSTLFTYMVSEKFTKNVYKLYFLHLSPAPLEHCADGAVELRLNQVRTQCRLHVKTYRTADVD